MSFLFSSSKSFTVTVATAKREYVFRASRSISRCTWKGQPEYKDGSPEQQKCIDYAFEAAKVLGFDAKGAVQGQIAGGFHNHENKKIRGMGPSLKWITIEYTDDEGKVLFHTKKDGSVWDRIHVYENPAINLLPEHIPVSIWAQHRSVGGAGRY